MSAAAPTLRDYADAWQAIRDGDLLLYRRRSLIAAVGRSPYSHAAMAGWAWDQWLCLEVREWYGGRIVTLESQVRQRPGRIDVFTPVVELDRDGAVECMASLAGCPYGWASVTGAALRHLPLVRLLVPADLDDAQPLRRPPFCSQAVALAYRQGGGLDPVPNLADRLTEPADLARSPHFEYRFTLR